METYAQVGITTIMKGGEFMFIVRMYNPSGKIMQETSFGRKFKAFEKYEQWLKDAEIYPKGYKVTVVMYAGKDIAWMHEVVGIGR